MLSEKELTDQLMKRRPKMINFATYQFKLSELDAEDLVSETFIKCLKFRERFDEGQGKISTWMYKILRNTFIDQFRSGKENFHKKLLPNEQKSNIEDGQAMRYDGEVFQVDFSSSVDAKAILAGLDRLPDRLRTPLKLRIEGLSYEEIAEEMGAPIGTVKAQMNRARQLMVRASVGLGMVQGSDLNHKFRHFLEGGVSTGDFTSRLIGNVKDGINKSLNEQLLPKPAIKPKTKYSLPKALPKSSPIPQAIIPKKPMNEINESPVKFYEERLKEVDKSYVFHIAAADRLKIERDGLRQMIELINTPSMPMGLPAFSPLSDTKPRVRVKPEAIAKREAELGSRNKRGPEGIAKKYLDIKSVFDNAKTPLTTREIIDSVHGIPDGFYATKYPVANMCLDSNVRSALDLLVRDGVLVKTKAENNRDHIYQLSNPVF